MFVLPLSDPLWRKLDDAHRDRDIPDVLRTLSLDWDEEVADSLFWDCLCHQDTCYGATYASVPHLLDIAKQPPAKGAVESIAQFLGHVSMVAFQDGGRSESHSLPQGLPLDLAAWDRKLDPYRSLAEFARSDLADPGYPENVLASFDNSSKSLADDMGFIQELLDEFATEETPIEAQDTMPRLSREGRKAELDRYTEILSRPAMNKVDLERLAQIREAFFQAQDKIAALCTRAYEAADRPEDQRCFLSGVVAAMGDRRLAQMLEHGDEGGFSCQNCDWEYEFAVYEQGMAVYASPVRPGEMYARAPGDDPGLLDYKDGAPNRADGFVEPREELSAVGSHAMALAEASNDQKSRRILKLYEGTYHCRKCNSRTRLA